MEWQPGLFSLLAFASTGVSCVVLLLSWRHRFEPAASAFLGVMVALGIWSFAYGVQLGFTTLAAQRPIQLFVLVVAAAVPTLWLVFALQYTDRVDRLSHRGLGVLTAEPIAFAALTLTNPAHGLVVEEAALVAVRDSFAVTMSFGPAYLGHVAYSYVVVAAGLGLLAAEYRESEFYRTQIALLVLGPLPALVAHVAHTLGYDLGLLPAVDLTPIAFTITGFLFAVVQFDLLDRVPVARAHALEETIDGFVVLDTEENVVSFNPASRQVLSSPAVGESFWACYPDAGDGERGLDAIDGVTLTTNADGIGRTVDVSCSTVTDRGGHAIGWVVSFRDVTDRHAYEQRLEVAHRVLRHNLRNQMNVVHGWAGHIAATGPEECARPARRITETAEELLSLSEKTRAMIATATALRGEPEPVPVTDRVESLAAAFRTDHPTVTVETQVPPETTALLPDESLFDVALRNLVENAILHNDDADPYVRVVVERSSEESTVRVSVVDNGPGIDEMELRVLREGTETPLHHGSGLGLWLVYWSVEAAGGEVTFEENDPRGSVVSFTLPAAKGSESAERTADPAHTTPYRA